MPPDPERTRCRRAHSDVPRKWVGDDEVETCMVCIRTFTFRRRRHHCRACGSVVCRSCSNRRTKVRGLHGDYHRVCDRCFNSTMSALLSPVVNKKMHAIPPYLKTDFCSESGLDGLPSALDEVDHLGRITETSLDIRTSLPTSPDCTPVVKQWGEDPSDARADCTRQEQQGQQQKEQARYEYQPGSVGGVSESSYDSSVGLSSERRSSCSWSSTLEQVTDMAGVSDQVIVPSSDLCPKRGHGGDECGGGSSGVGMDGARLDRGLDGDREVTAADDNFALCNSAQGCSETSHGMQQAQSRDWRRKGTEVGGVTKRGAEEGGVVAAGGEGRGAGGNGSGGVQRLTGWGWIKGTESRGGVAARYSSELKGRPLTLVSEQQQQRGTQHSVTAFGGITLVSFVFAFISVVLGFHRWYCE